MVRQAREWGARLVGLGGLLSVVTRNGTTVDGDETYPVTTGNSLTAYAAAEGVREAARRHHDDRRVPVAVLGAYGNVGSALCQILAREGFPVILFGNPGNPLRRQLLERTRDSIVAAVGPGADISIGENTSALGTAPLIVVTCTSDPNHRVDPAAFPAGTTILDLAIPANVVPRMARDPLRPVYRAGLLRPPNTIPGLDLLELSGGSVYGCLAETLVLGMSRRFEAFSRGALAEDRIREIGEVARAQGFRPTLDPVRYG